jgi:hypothetical protein
MSVQPIELHEVTCLVEELAEATLDTVEMYLERPYDEDWASHAVYLQQLHLVSQAVLARMGPA